MLDVDELDEVIIAQLALDEIVVLVRDELDEHQHISMLLDEDEVELDVLIDLLDEMLQLIECDEIDEGDEAILLVMSLDDEDDEVFDIVNDEIDETRVIDEDDEVDEIQLYENDEIDDEDVSRENDDVHIIEIDEMPELFLVYWFTITRIDDVLCSEIDETEKLIDVNNEVIDEVVYIEIDE